MKWEGGWRLIDRAKTSDCMNAGREVMPKVIHNKLFLWLIGVFNLAKVYESLDIR